MAACTAACRAPVVRRTSCRDHRDPQDKPVRPDRQAEPDLQGLRARQGSLDLPGPPALVGPLDLPGLRVRDRGAICIRLL